MESYSSVLLQHFPLCSFLGQVASYSFFDSITKLIAAHSSQCHGLHELNLANVDFSHDPGVEDQEVVVSFLFVAEHGRKSQSNTS